MSPRRLLARVHRRLVPPEAGIGWTAYLWLIYLAFFFIEWFFRPMTPLEAVAIVVTMIAFLALYFSAFRRQGRDALLHVGAIAALAVAWAGLSAGSSVFFIYAASFAFLVGPPRVSIWVVAAIAAIAGLTAIVVDAMLFYWLPGVFISMVIGAANIFFGEQQRRNAELRLSQAEVRRLARVAERERIARDLHDVLGHTLSLISVKSELAGRLLDRDPGRAREEIESIRESARHALAEVREAIGGFREQTLEQALDHVRASLRAADVELESEVDPDLALPRQHQAMLALVIREAATNIIRHAGARRARLVLECYDSAYRLVVTDDGPGRIRSDGGGIQGMRARIESLGGMLAIDENGKTIVATVPEPEP
ncbi:MAG: sensor histidine kinase [Candidatus Wenzhouxiangella sp. M2_3B_020]